MYVDQRITHKKQAAPVCAYRSVNPSPMHATNHAVTTAHTLDAACKPQAPSTLSHNQTHPKPAAPPSRRGRAPPPRPARSPSGRRAVRGAAWLSGGGCGGCVCLDVWLWWIASFDEPPVHGFEIGGSMARHEHRSTATQPANYQCSLPLTAWLFSHSGLGMCVK